MSASWEIRQGDALDQLRAMPDGSVHCCITSPPYYGLRDYGTGEWSGGDPGCDHVKRDLSQNDNLAQSATSTRGGASSRSDAEPLRYGSVCEKCGAERTDQQIGLEQTPEQFVAKLVDVFAEVRRVLRDDGTLWLNLGDSYARSAGPRKGNFGRSAKGIGIPEDRDSRRRREWAKDKDLLGIPWMVAFALRADGWYLRSEVIWAKPNPMPESTTDRPTKAHEQVFLLSKAPRYYYDADAIREPVSGTAHARRKDGSPNPKALIHTGSETMRPKQNASMAAAINGLVTQRNKRSVWEIASRPYPDAHFATFPPKLVEPMVLAGAAPQTCAECAAPWRRLTEVEYENLGNRTTNGPRSEERKHEEFGTAGYAQRLERRSRTVGWEPTCDHADGGGHSVVLDPFAGTGTTLQVAVERGRDAIGIELNPESVLLVEKRMSGVMAPLFAEDAA